MPSSKAPSSSAGATATDLRNPRTSVNHSRTNRTSRSSSARSTKSSCLPMRRSLTQPCYGDVAATPRPPGPLVEEAGHVRPAGRRGRPRPARPSPGLGGRVCPARPSPGRGGRVCPARWSRRRASAVSRPPGRARPALLVAGSVRPAGRGGALAPSRDHRAGPAPRYLWQTIRSCAPSTPLRPGSIGLSHCCVTSAYAIVPSVGPK